MAKKNDDTTPIRIGEKIPSKLKSKTPPKARGRKPTNKPSKEEQQGYSKVPVDKALDIFVSPVSRWPVEAAVGALNSFEQGSFSSAGRLAENMTRDSRVGSVLDTRVLGVLGLPFEWVFDKPPTAEDLGALEVMQGFWPGIFKDSVSASCLRWAILMGNCIVNNYWDDIQGYSVPKLTVWHPSNTYYNVGTRKLNAITQTDGVVEINHGDYRWMVFKLLDHERPWMSGAIRRLAFSYLSRQYALNDWRMNSATYGNPIRKFKPTVESAAQVDTFQFMQDLANRIRMGAPVMMPVGWDLEQMEATQHSPEMFKLLIDKCDTDIAISVLGQNLTTENSQGSLAATQVHMQILQKYIDADVGMLERTLYNQLIQPFYKFNFDDSVQVPHPKWNSVRPEDTAELAKSMSDRADSLVKLGTAISGFKEAGLLEMINIEELFRELRVPLKTKYETSQVNG